MAEIGRLQSFINIASAPGVGEKDAIKLRGDGDLRLTGRAGTFFTFASTHRDTMKAFIGAVCEQYGDHVADLTSNRLADEMAAGKPLSAYRVRELAAAAAYDKLNVNGAMGLVANNGLTLNRFVASEAFTAVIDELCDSRGVPSGESRQFLRDQMKHTLLNRYADRAFNSQILTQEKLRSGVLARDYNIVGANLFIRANFFAGANFDTALDFLGSAGAGLPATPAEKICLLEMGIGRNSSRGLFRAAWEIVAIRDAGGNGEFSRETVWRELFGENLPDDLSPEEFGAALDARVDREFDELVAASGKKAHIIDGALCVMPWKKLKPLAMSPGIISTEDAPNVKSMIGHQGEYRAALHSLCTDPPRRGKFHDKNLPLPTFTFDLNNGQPPIRITVGHNPNPSCRDEDDEKAYRGGSENSISRRLEELSQTICGGEKASEKQIANVMLCLGQCTLLMLKRLAPLAGVDLGSFAEHANVSVTLTRQPDGTVRAEFSTPKENKGSFSMRLDILSDGDIKVESFNLTPPQRRVDDSPQTAEE